MADLNIVFEKQKELQIRMGYDIDEMDAKERTTYIKEYANHLSVETSEMLMELPFFKPWKKYEWSLEEYAERMLKAQEEYIDMLHFFAIIGIALGLSADDVIEGYVAKNAVNHQRQDNTEVYKRCTDEA